MSDERENGGNPYMAGLLTNEYEPDDLPIALPDGVISFLGSAWHGEHEVYPIIDMKVSIEGETIKVLLTTEMARDVVRALEAAIRAAEETAGPIEERTGGAS